MIRERPPATWLHCPALPPVPVATRQSEVADYLARLHETAMECREALAQIRKWSEQQ